MIGPLVALLVMLAVPLGMLGAEVHTFRGRRIRWWQSYAYHFPEAPSTEAHLKAGPLVADLGELSLKHIWYHIRVEGWSWLLPWRAEWLMAELNQDGLRLRNSPSIFESVNQLPSLWIPRERMLWATVSSGNWVQDATLSLDAKGEFEPGKDPAFSLPLQVNLRLHLDSNQQARAWVAQLQSMGVSIMGAEALER